MSSPITKVYYRQLQKCFIIAKTEYKKQLNITRNIFKKIFGVNAYLKIKCENVRF